MIDDNVAIHGDFKKILGPKELELDAMDEMEASLFGTETPGPDVSKQFEIDFASQGQEGVEMVIKAKAEGRPYSLAFVDGRMPPGWDGVETIHNLWKEARDLQVVLCTAYSDYSWKDIRTVLGESDSLLILKKPFDNMEVLQITHSMTRKWELGNEVRNHLEHLNHQVLQKSEEKDQARSLLEAALAHSPAGIIITDSATSKILWVNSSAREICGAPPEESMNNDDSNLFCQLEILNLDKRPNKKGEIPFLDCIRNGLVIREKEFILRNAYGKENYISVNASPIFDHDGSMIACIIIFQDVTERKDSEKEREKLQMQLNQSQKMESIGHLAGGVAHDFNNMLAIILAHTELAMDELHPKDPMFSTFESIRETGLRSASLTQQLLTFARKQVTTPEVLDLNEKIKGTLSMLYRLVGEEISIAWEPEPAIWPVKMDATQLDQILINLCVNARDAINGIGSIYIKAGNETIGHTDDAPFTQPCAGEYVALHVMDNGKGIEKTHLDHIFDPFFTTKGRFKSTGLGLATVYGITKQNDGFIYVKSDPGKGTVFSVYIPRYRGKRIVAAITPEVKNQCSKGEGVLVVEDEKELLEMNQQILERLGYNVFTAMSPHEAIEVAEANSGKLDLLMTDVILPEMNGRSLARLLLSKHSKLKCLFLSGYTDDMIDRHGVLDDDVHFLKKPFSIKELSMKVREVLDDEKAPKTGVAI